MGSPSSINSWDMAFLSKISGDHANADFAIHEAQVVAQWETQDLLEASNRIAIESNAELSNINGTLLELLDRQSKSVDLQNKTNQILSNIQTDQKQHLNQVRRERALKEVLFQIEKYLESPCFSKNRMTSFFAAELLLNVLDQNGFGTQDLGDITDKRFYDSILIKAKDIIRSVSIEENVKLNEFRQAYGVYVLRKEQGPSKTDRKKNISAWIPTQSPFKPYEHISRPVLQEETVKEEDLSGSSTLSYEEAKEQALKEYMQKNNLHFITIDRMRRNFLLYSCGSSFFFKKYYSNEYEKSVSFIYRNWISYKSKPYLNSEEVKARVEDLIESPRTKYQKEKRIRLDDFNIKLQAWKDQQSELEKWRKSTEEWESREAQRLIKYNQEVQDTKLYNLGLDEKQQSYNKTFSNVLDALRKRINGFLDENLSLQDFFDKVKGAND